MLLVLLLWQTPGIIWMVVGFFLYGYYLDALEKHDWREQNHTKTWEEQRVQAQKDCQRYAGLYHKARKELEKFDRVMQVKKEMGRRKAEYRKVAIEFDRLVASHYE